MTIQELRRKKQELTKAMSGILAQGSPIHGLSDAQEAQWQAHKAELQGVNRQIAALESGFNTGRIPAHLEAWSPIETVSDATPAVFKSFGEFAQACARASRPGGFPDRRLELIQAAAAGANEAIGSEGGFLVETQYQSEIYNRIYDTGQIAGRCLRIPIRAGANGVKLMGVDETSRANGSRWGGVQAYWAAEAATVTASQPKFRLIELVLKKLFAISYATDELVSDAAALGVVLGQAFTEELAFKLDDAIVNGTGAGMPLGILNSPALVVVGAESGQSSKTVVPQNIFKLWSRLWHRSRQNAVWLINQDIEPQLHGMALPVGTGGVPVYLPAGGLSGNQYSTLYGRPVIPVEQCATLGTVGDIILADLSQYVLIDKGGIQADSSIHVKFTTDETTFRYVMRVDGSPLWSSVLTPYKGAANTLSPFVTLAAR